MKKLDAFQVLRSVYDDPLNCLRVCVVDGTTGGNSGFEVIIDYTNDSIAIAAGGQLLTSTAVGGKQALDVNVANIGESVTNDGLGNPISSKLTQDGTERGLHVMTLNRLIPCEFDDIQITQFTAEGDPEIVIYRSDTNIIATLTITYNTDGEVERVRRT